MSNPAVLLIGGPETGKSNFLFRSWTHIFSADGLIEKDGMPATADYLQEGAEFQLRGEFAGHTSQETPEISEIPIVQKGNPQNKALLIVPDVDGEQINRIYRDRKWSHQWEALVTENTAYLFFVRVNSPQTVVPLDWITCHKLYGGAPPLKSEGEGAKADSGDSEKDRVEGTNKPANEQETGVETPTQVVLVDWLQFIRDALHSKYSYAIQPRVGIVVAGWDCVPPDLKGGASEWIRENMPLLHQFCVTNNDVFDFAFFGSSIFSGDPQNDPDFAEELEKKDTRTVGYVRYSPSNKESADFTIPIAWALRWESTP